MRPTILALALATSLAFAAAADARPPRAELVGIRLGMSEEEAHEHLSKLGKQAQEKNEREEEEQESWSLDRGPWGYVALGVEEERVRWVTVFARRGGPAVRYRDLGSLEGSRRSGTYFLTWSVPARAGARPYTVIARGNDSLYVTSVSLVSDSLEAARSQSAPSDSSRDRDSR